MSMRASGGSEQWDRPDLPGMPGVVERKIPLTEALLDQTVLKWEVATRQRFGMVAAVPESSFKIVLRKSTGLTPATRSKEELALEYEQAMADLRAGRLTVVSGEHGEIQTSLTEDSPEAWDIAACAAFKDAFDKRLQEASREEEEGGLTAERQREIQRALEHDIRDMDPGDLDGKERDYLPESWFSPEPPKAKLDGWKAKICAHFHEMFVEEIVDIDGMCLMRKLMYDFRMESDPNAYAAMGLLVDRVRRAPKCFGYQVLAHLWSANKDPFAVVLQINYAGLHLYTSHGESQSLLCSLTYDDALVSWDAINDMLTVHVVHRRTKTSARLHFLTRESLAAKALLTRYAAAFVVDLAKSDKEEALRQQAKARELTA